MRIHELKFVELTKEQEDKQEDKLDIVLQRCFDRTAK